MVNIGIYPRGFPGLPQADAAISVWNTENWFFEDLEIADKIRSNRRTISEGEPMTPNSMMMDYHPYVGYERFATDEASLTVVWLRDHSYFRGGFDWSPPTA